jgi:hypothetical protein
MTATATRVGLSDDQLEQVLALAGGAAKTAAALSYFVAQLPESAH